MKHPEEIHQIFIELVDKFNQYWQQNRLDDLAGLLDEEVAFVSPGFRHSVTGIKACVDTFIQFSENAIVEFFEHEPPQVHVSGDTAVTAYSFRIRYLFKRQSYEETGTDILVWKKKAGNNWRIVWRGMVNLKKH